MAGAPFNMPGYSWDGTRFYKDIPGIPKPRPIATATESKSTQRKKLKRTHEKGKWKAATPWSPNTASHSLRSMYDSLIPGPSHRHRIECLAISKAASRANLYPDCIPMGSETISALDFDQRDPSLLRIGCSSGTIASGSLGRAHDPDLWVPNDEMGWRTAWILPAPVTSLHTCGDRMLATCLGPPAQAIVATTSNNISLASVTLSPRKTSLWTSALSPSLIALGCDTKVLVSRDPSRNSMIAYTTGDKFGGGAVFALELVEDNLVVAGTRKGDVKMFDTRSFSSSQAQETRPEMRLSVSSSVIHLRHLSKDHASGYGLLVSSMDGSMGVYDTRFINDARASTSAPRRRPVLQLKEHSNQYTINLGLDVWQDDFVAAAGSDGRIRIWSLRAPHGNPIAATPQPSVRPIFGDRIHSSSHISSSALAHSASDSPWTRTFAEPVPALKFADRNETLGVYLGERKASDRRDNTASVESRMELEKAGDDARAAVSSRKAGLPALWIGTGPTVECFDFGRLV